MPNRSSKRKLDEEDPNVTAFNVVQQATAENNGARQSGPPRVKNSAAVALGRLGGKKGGPARAKKLSPERRSEIARKAAAARWSKTRETEGAEG